MKEIKLENIKIIEHKIWNMFNTLRGESLATEEYYVLLFLLSLYKDGIISTKLLTEVSLHKSLRVSITDSQDLLTQRYFPIYPSFELTLNRISSMGLKSLLQSISNLDWKILSENFSEIFDSVL